MSVLKYSARGDSVRRLQKQLKEAGFDPGKADGIFGPRTLRAVKGFQAAKGLEADGRVGRQTDSVLRSRPARDDFSASTVGAPPRRRAARAAPSASEAGARSWTPQPTAAANPEQRVGTAAPASSPAQSGEGANRTATFDHVAGAGRRNQMVAGRITVNGHTYSFRSGGFGRGNLPPGPYTVTPHQWTRSDRSMSVDGVGYSFALSNSRDSRVGGVRDNLRIHPDGGTAGTEGCLGIVGNGALQRQFRADMRAELDRGGGRFTLHIG
jgi:lysozyme family protein